MASTSTSNGTNLKQKYSNKPQTKGTHSNTDLYGFKRSDDFDYKQYEDFQSEYLTVLTRRSMRWNSILKAGNQKKVKRDGTVKRFCRKGIPAEHRAMVWMDVSGARKKLKMNPGYYEILQQSHNKDGKEEDMVKQIDIDLFRTFPDNIHFNSSSNQDKKLALANILRAYGKHQPKIGYCQGINYIAGILLLVVSDEEKCFWLLSALIDDILPEYYNSSMSGTRAEIGVLAELVSERYPEVQRVMDRENVPWSLIASKWFICLFIDVIPVETVLRVWDCIMFEGSKVLLRAALYLVDVKQHELINSTSGMADIIHLFKNLPTDSHFVNCHHFMQNMFNRTNPLSGAKIQQLRDKHLKLVAQDDEKARRKE